MAPESRSGREILAGMAELRTIQRDEEAGQVVDLSRVRRAWLPEVAHGARRALSWT